MTKNELSNEIANETHYLTRGEKDDYLLGAIMMAVGYKIFKPSIETNLLLEVSYFAIKEHVSKEISDSIDELLRTQPTPAAPEATEGGE